MGEEGVGGGGGGNLGIILVRVCVPVFRNLPHSYTWPLKKRTHSYTRSSDKLTQSYIAHWYLFPFVAGIYTNIAVNSLTTKRTNSLKNLWVKNTWIYRNVRKKWGLSYTNQEKPGQSYTFCWKNGANHIPGSAEKGGHSARTSVLCVPPTPHPRVVECLCDKSSDLEECIHF